MFRRILILLLVATILLSGCDLANNFVSKAENIATNLNIEKASEKQIERETVYVQRVIDSDTISFFRKQNGKYDQSKVYKGRLLGINGPENTTKKEKFGDISTKFLRKLIEGKEIIIERDIDLMDKYGRDLIHIFYNNNNINELLIEKGLVRVAYLYNDYKYIDNYKAAEVRAKDSKFFIWSITDYVVENGNGYNMNAVK